METVTFTNEPIAENSCLHNGFFANSFMASCFCVILSILLAVNTVASVRTPIGFTLKALGYTLGGSVSLLGGLAGNIAGSTLAHGVSYSKSGAKGLGNLTGFREKKNQDRTEKYSSALRKVALNDVAIKNNMTKWIKLGNKKPRSL